MRAFAHVAKVCTVRIILAVVNTSILQHVNIAAVRWLTCLSQNNGNRVASIAVLPFDNARPAGRSSISRIFLSSGR